ncbi:MAG: hypothetical protein GEU95_17690 [Rhizobiales bacterium]|nr:hypothetical protein [Hyphomicrobiales bacterium]
MSIVDLIADRVGAGMLFPLIPRTLGTSPKRSMLIGEELWRFLQEPEEDPEWEDRKGFLQADLELFAEGAPIGPKYLFLLSPAREAVWEIRSVRPNPSIRVLGRFIAKDIFVATNYALRKDLDGWETREWRDAKLRSRTIWTNLFHPYQPLVTTRVEDLASGVIDGKYFKGD